MGKEEWKGGESFYDQFDKYERILRVLCGPSIKIIQRRGTNMLGFCANNFVLHARVKRDCGAATVTTIDSFRVFRADMGVTIGKTLLYHSLLLNSRCMRRLVEALILELFKRFLESIMSFRAT
mgnify:CR=1 FL=1